MIDGADVDSRIPNPKDDAFEDRIPSPVSSSVSCTPV